MEKIWHRIIKWINETIDLCPLESVRKQRRRQGQMQSSWKFFCQLSVLHLSHLPWKEKAQMGPGKWVVQMFDHLLFDFCRLSLTECGDWLAEKQVWLVLFECVVVPALGKERWQAEAIWRFVGILGSKERSAECIMRSMSPLDPTAWASQPLMVGWFFIALYQLREMLSQI